MGVQLQAADTAALTQKCPIRLFLSVTLVRLVSSPLRANSLSPRVLRASCVTGSFFTEAVNPHSEHMFVDIHGNHLYNFS